MVQKENNHLVENLNSNRCLLLGEKITFNEETLNALLLLGFEHLYLINTPIFVLNYIKTLFNEDSLTISNSLSEIQIKNDFDVCIIGFPAIPNDIFKKFKNSKRNILVFFDEPIGGFQSLWVKAFINLKIIELPLSSYFASKNNEIVFTERLDKTIPDFFTNRGNEIDAYRRFILTPRIRAAKIIGLEGIGKKSFINYLKTFHDLEKNCFEFYFTSENNSIFDVIYELGKYLSVKPADKEISSIRKDYNPSSILRLFEKFDKIENGKIIFRNINFVYDISSNEFTDKLLGVFFHNLLNRNSYNGNRIYFVANSDFLFPIFQTDDLCASIYLPAINSRFIKIIMEREFIQNNKTVLATRIMQLDENIVSDLINGHPHIAKMFVKACENASIDTIINDENFRKKFEDDKIKYLFDIITLNANHKALDYLNYFCCINGKFEKVIIDAVCGDDNVETISYLRSRFFLEVEHYENKSESYEVPILIRKFIKSSINKGNFKIINNFLGEFFWEIATDFKTPTIKMIQAFRYAEFHFNESENIEMQKKLISLFMEKYLQRANLLYEQHKFSEAYFLYKELYERNYITDGKYANFFIVCCSKIRAEDAEIFMLRVHSDFPESKFITNTIANYYYELKKFENALDFISKSTDLQPNDFVSQALYYNILSKIGRENEAFEFYDKKLKAHLNPKLSIEERNQLVKYLMNYFQILRYNEYQSELIENISNTLSTAEQKIFKNYLFSNIDLENAQDISTAFNRALDSKYVDAHLKELHTKYIARQNNFTIVSKSEILTFRANQAEKLKSEFSNHLSQAKMRLNKSLEIIRNVDKLDSYNQIVKLALPVILINQYNLKLISTLMTPIKDETMKIKIVFAAANPDGEANLRLDREYRSIDELLQASKERDRIELLSKWATRLSDFTKVMLDSNPQIIHFAGHGNKSGLAFENDNGDIELVNKEGLDRLFSLFIGVVQCVVLNSCYSEDIAQTISNHDIYVVGMNNAIGDNAARKFSVGFYQAYAAGRDIEAAFQMGLVHISNLIDDKNVPSLWKNGTQLK